MSDVSSSASAEKLVAEPKVRAKAKKQRPKKLAKAPVSTKLDFEFVGRVTSINMNGAGPDSYQFMFTLENKKGKDKAYLVDATEPMRFSAMASLLSAAYATQTKVHIRSVPNPNGPPYAAELEIRAKT